MVPVPAMFELLHRGGPSGNAMWVRWARATRPPRTRLTRQAIDFTSPLQSLVCKSRLPLFKAPGLSGNSNSSLVPSGHCTLKNLWKIKKEHKTHKVHEQRDHLTATLDCLTLASYTQSTPMGTLHYFSFAMLQWFQCQLLTSASPAEKNLT